MIACVNPCDAFLDENVSTLTYATKAGNIANEPIKNVDPKTKALRGLKAEVANLKKELLEAQKHIDLLSATNESSRGGIK